MLEDLRREREEQGYTCTDIGSMFGLSKSGYRQIEVGKTILSYERAVEIATLLGKKPDDIFLKDIILMKGENFRFIQDASEKTVEYIKRIENIKYADRLEVCIDLFKKWSNKSISNGKGVVFKPSAMGFDDSLGTEISDFLFVMLNNDRIKKAGKLVLTKNDDSICNDTSRKIIADFKKLEFTEQVDVLTELIVKLDNKTLFMEKTDFPKFSRFMTGYDVGNEMRNFKKAYIQVSNEQ